jgi:hypothetical protein
MIREDSCYPWFLNPSVRNPCLQVNGPVGDKELAFRFPQGIGVLDVKKGVYYIWGYGAWAMTLTTDQYNEMRKRELLRAQGRVIEWTQHPSATGGRVRRPSRGARAEAGDDRPVDADLRRSGIRRGPISPPRAARLRQRRRHKLARISLSSPGRTQIVMNGQMPDGPGLQE